MGSDLRIGLIARTDGNCVKLGWTRGARPRILKSVAQSQIYWALVGVAVGAGVAVLLALLGRWWSFTDARAASRRSYAQIVALRLKRFVTVSTEPELDEIRDELFEVSSMSIHVPSGEGVVHVWFVINQAQLFRDAVKKVQAGKLSDQQVNLFGDALDVLSEVQRWARGDWSRSAGWFWIQVRTTHRYEWTLAQRKARQDHRARKAVRRAASRDAAKRLRSERSRGESGTGS
jgi:hypothetical protein